MASIKSQIFDTLSKGVIISINSDKYHEMANYLNIDENFEAFNETINEIGYKVVGENGYFYLSKNEKLENSEVENFIAFHKKTIVAISILKQIYPLIASADIISFTDFIVEFEKKLNPDIEDKLNYLFSSDKKTQIEELFKLLEKNFIIEKVSQKDKNSYKVLNSINYFVKIVESV
jgi:hypothetical protein